MSVKTDGQRKLKTNKGNANERPAIQRSMPLYSKGKNRHHTSFQIESEQSTIMTNIDLSGFAIPDFKSPQNVKVPDDHFLIAN